MNKKKNVSQVMTLCRGQIVGDKKKVCFPPSIMKNMENGKLPQNVKKRTKYGENCLLKRPPGMVNIFHSAF